MKPMKPLDLFPSVAGLDGFFHGSKFMDRGQTFSGLA